MVFEAVHEHGRWWSAATHGAEEEIWAAGNGHAIRARQVHLRFHLPACRAGLSSLTTAEVRVQSSCT